MDNKKKIAITITSILVVLVLIVGVTYALEIFKESSGDNTIKSGKISMNYTESSNVINITNALPMTDTDGKQQTNYFDFSITSNADTNIDDDTTITIPYNLLLAPKGPDSDKKVLNSNQIKVYLTKIENGAEIIVLEPTLISSLKEKDTNYNLYSTMNTHKNNNGKITTKYRLRAWIDHNVDSTDFNKNTYQYKFAVNVNSIAKTGAINLDRSGANAPMTSDNMIPVYYDTAKDVWKKADILNADPNNQWYDYDKKMWANAVTVVNDSYLPAKKDAKNEYTYISNNRLKDNSESNGKFTFTTGSTGGNYSFDYSVSSEEDCDKLTIIVNGSTVVNGISGETKSTYSGTLEPNTEYTINIKYTKDEYTDFKKDMATIGNFKLPSDLSKPLTLTEEGTYPFTVGEQINRNYYIDAKPGTEVPMGDINTMWVWIPRFKYTYFKNSRPVEIPITFESGTETTGTIKCVDAIGQTDSEGNNISEKCTDTVNSTIQRGVSTYTHPAFTFGEDELTGIWMGKFETSAVTIPTESSSTEVRDILIKPNQAVWHATALSYYFKGARKMELKDNMYGFQQTGTYLNANTGEITNDSNNLDTHIARNMDWGATAYLSHSKYGTCTEGMCEPVWKNNSGPYVTGASGDSYDQDKVSSPLHRYQETNGQKASTTHNIYGIYDMSGGAQEYVMGNASNSDGSFNGGTLSSTNPPLDKYYDKYTTGSSVDDFTRGKLGDATIEMDPGSRTWYNDIDAFVVSYQMWFERGAHVSYGDKCGIFAFNRIQGIADIYVSFRMALTYQK